MVTVNKQHCDSKVLSFYSSKSEHLCDMSYRDLRNFSEDMRALGFPEHISLESFRTPNWDLLESCLRWLTARLEPDAVLAGGKDTVEQRVSMVLHAVEIFHSRANLKLNGKKVYGADGWAVRELLKVAALLRAALAAPPPADRPDRALLYDVSARVGDIRRARGLATDLAAQGAHLADALAKEPENKEARGRALARPLESGATEAALRGAVAALEKRVAEAREAREGAEAGAASLAAKLERRRAELQRAEKRLRTVQKIKPAYQAELTALEAEVERLWDEYVPRYRCVEALKHRLSLLETAQSEAAEEQQASILQLIHKYEAEDVLGKLSDSDASESSEGESRARAPRPRSRLRIRTAGKAESRGAWAGRDSLDIRDEDDSDSDSEPELSDAELLVAASGRHSRRPATRTLPPNAAFAGLAPGPDRKDEESVGSSSESELRLSPRLGRASASSDNEF